MNKRYELIEIEYLNAQSDIVSRIIKHTKIDNIENRRKYKHYFVVGRPKSRVYIIDDLGRCEEVI